MTDLSLAETQLGQAGTHVDLGPLSQSGGSHAGKEKAGGRMRERPTHLLLQNPPPPYTEGSQAPNTPKSLPVAAAPPSGPGHPAARQREPDPRHIWF